MPTKVPPHIGLGHLEDTLGLVLAAQLVRAGIDGAAMLDAIAVEVAGLELQESPQVRGQTALVDDVALLVPPGMVLSRQVEDGICQGSVPSRASRVRPLVRQELQLRLHKGLDPLDRLADVVGAPHEVRQSEETPDEPLVLVGHELQVV